MTPRRLDPDSVQRKLVGIRDLVDQLADHDADRLAEDPVARGATLWVMTQLVSLAAGASAHLAAALLDRAPATQRESFELVVQAGVVDEGLLDDLRGAAGMRNLLVHEYGEIDLAQVAEAIPSARRTFTAFVQQVAAHLDDHGNASSPR